MITNIQQLIAFLPFFILIFSLTTVILSISYSRNHFFIAVFVTLSFIAVFFSLFFLIKQIPLSINTLFYINGDSVFYMAMITISSISTCIFSYPSLVKYPYNKEEFYLLILISNLGAILSIISNHMSSLFMNIEIMSIPMFGLIAYFDNKKYSLEAAFKYIILSSIGSSFLILGISWIYSISGSLNFESINPILNIISLNEQLVILFGMIMIMVSLLFKLSIVPFHLWTPDVYQGTPPLILSFFSTVGKIASFSILFNFLSNFSDFNNNILYFLLLLITIFSMLIGNLMALFQNNLKRFFGYSSISQLGYLFVVFLVSKNNHFLSLEASLIYLCGYLFSNIAFFGIINLVSNFYDHSVNSISSYKGLFWSEPVLSSILTFILLSLAGFPMTLGFIGKFYILSIIIKEHLWVVGISFLFSTLLGFYCYLRIIITLYLRSPKISLVKKLNIFNNWLYLPSGIMILISAIIIVMFGIYPTPLINFIKFILLL